MSNKPKYSTKSSPKGKFNIETGEFDPPVRFFNIPFEWAQYLTGYEFEAVNRDGTPKLTKGRKPVEKKIDYLDLMILDYIRSFAARRNRYCFAESAAVADAVGMVGQEREICERVLQLAAIGFIQVKQVIHPYKRSVLRLLEVNEKKIKECILSRKESILNEMLELQKSPDFTGDKYTFKTYLQEYIQEELQEEIQEALQERLSEELSDEACNDVFGVVETRRAVRKQ